ncbi:MAG: DUF4159 domain-containing protein [Lentisphaeraceae bacterium]|nr:DUF4159 domain-containing protein [Lentisphaeraceae bacterium]
MKICIFILVLIASIFTLADEVSSAQIKEKTQIKCGNLIYSGTRSSVCFSDKFLSRASTMTNLNLARNFTEVKLASEELFDTPLAVFSGEGSFSLNSDEQANFRKYILSGGFIMASPGCSNADWDTSFKQMIKTVFPKLKFQKIPMEHPIFNLIYKVPVLTLKSGGTAMIDGLFMDDKLVMVYSREGLNDVKNAKGCCCCGGNEIKQSQQVNVNILTYVLLN